MTITDDVLLDSATLKKRLASEIMKLELLTEQLQASLTEITSVVETASKKGSEDGK